MIAWDIVVKAAKRYLGLPTTHKEQCERLLEASYKSIHIEEQYLSLLEFWTTIDLSKLTSPRKREAINITIETYCPNVVLFSRHLVVVGELIHNEERSELSRFIKNNLTSQKVQNLDSWLVDVDGIPEDLIKHLHSIQKATEFQYMLFDNQSIASYAWSLTKVYDDLYAISAIVVSLLGD